MMASLSGAAGCNNYTGGYTVSGYTVDWRR
jgi:heat shock protein HslJ